MELRLPPIPPPRKNPMNGQYLKGHVPHNKGKKWTDYLDMRKAKRVKKNLEIGRARGNPSMAGWNAIKVVGIKDGKFTIFDSSEHAGRALGIIARNIRHCCHKKRKRAGGIRWFFAASDEWLPLVEKPNIAPNNSIYGNVFAPNNSKNQGIIAPNN